MMTATAAMALANMIPNVILALQAAVYVLMTHPILNAAPKLVINANKNLCIYIF